MEEQRTKRIPKCGYCQNHGIKNPLRGKIKDIFKELSSIQLFKYLFLKSL